MASPLSDRAIYLGEGVWWQLTEYQVSRGIGRGLPQCIRPATVEGIDDKAISIVIPPPIQPIVGRRLRGAYLIAARPTGEQE